MTSCYLPMAAASSFWLMGLASSCSKFRLLVHLTGQLLHLVLAPQALSVLLHLRQHCHRLERPQRLL